MLNSGNFISCGGGVGTVKNVMASTMYIIKLHFPNYCSGDEEMYRAVVSNYEERQKVCLSN